MSGHACPPPSVPRLSAPPAEPRLPPVTDVQRLRLEPGDSLVIRVDAERLSAEMAAHVKDKIRAVLRLGESVPLIVLGRHESITILPAGPDAPGSDAVIWQGCTCSTGITEGCPLHDRRKP